MSARGPLPASAVAVRLEPHATAYIVLDLADPHCAQRPSCLASLPAAAAILKRAREAGVLVIFTLGRARGQVVRVEVEPREGESIVASSADRFFGTPLDEMLRARLVRTLILGGVSADGAVLYTAFAACARGYTVVVAEDAIGAEDPLSVTVARYQLLHQPGFSNVENEPLRERAVTLSRSDRIHFAPRHLP